VIAALPAAAAATAVPRAAALVDGGDLARIEGAVRELLAPAATLDPTLAAAVGETVARSGSLWRAQLAWAVARAHGAADATALAAATAVEAFHTASLLFDDLPAMDDGAERRGAPCVHLKHGEAAAMLAGLAFVHRGYARLWRALENASPERRALAALRVEACLGLDGILDGQARDVHFAAAGATAEEVLAIAEGKTVTLLRLALELPALLAGASDERLARLRRLALAWGLAYQIADDLADPDGPGGGDDRRRGRPNLALVAGPAAAARELARRLDDAAAESAALVAELPRLAGPFGRLEERLRRAAPLAPRLVAGG